MGLLDAIGFGETPFGQYFAQNPNFIGSVGAGFGSGRNFGEGLSRAAQLAPQGRSLDVAAAAQREEKAQEQQRINQTLQLMQRDYPDLAQMFEGGTPEIQSGAVSEMFRRMGQSAQGPDYRTVGDTLLEIGADGVRPVYTTPQAPTAPASFNTLDLDEQIRLESAAAKDYRGYDEVATYNKIRDSYERIRQSASQDSPSGDMGLIFNFMKMLDPGSTVREGEFATAQQTTGVPGYIVNLYNQAINGTRLNPQQRRQFVELAQGLYNETAQNLTALNEQVTPRYTSYGMDPSRFTITPETYDQIDTSQWSAAPGMPEVEMRRIQ